MIHRRTRRVISTAALHTFGVGGGCLLEVCCVDGGRQANHEQMLKAVLRDGERRLGLGVVAGPLTLGGCWCAAVTSVTPERAYLGLEEALGVEEQGVRCAIPLW